MTSTRRHASAIVLSLLTLLPLAACGPIGAGSPTPASPTATAAPNPPPPKSNPKSGSQSKSQSKSQSGAKSQSGSKSRSGSQSKSGSLSKSGSGSKSGTVVKSTPGTTARDPLFGVQYAYFKSADLGNRRITFDLIEWYDGKAAVRACKADGERPAENDWCTGWYIRNKSARLRTLTVYPDAPLRVCGLGAELKVTNLKGFVAGLRSNGLFSFDVDANRIMEAHQVYTP